MPPYPQLAEGPCRVTIRTALQARGASNIAPYIATERASWRSPNDILSILMLVGGDIVQRAVAQLSGSGPWYCAPVAFSFGWLAYSVSALTSSLGDRRLMPPPDFAAKVANADSGYVRDNASWALGRLLRDHEKRMVKQEKNTIALTIAFYRTRRDDPCAGIPKRDWVYWTGVATILLQLGIAIVPGAWHGNWIVLIVTAGGTALALATTAQPQWYEEKYAARKLDKKKSREVACITRGNGSVFVMVVDSSIGSLRLEDLAAGRDRRRTTMLVVSAIFTVLWIVLLLTVEGVDNNGDVWFLLTIGGLGEVQNVVAAGAARAAEALGFHYEPMQEGDIIAETKVMKALEKAEKKQAGVGLCLLPLFFPGDLRDDEKLFWGGMRESKATRWTEEMKRMDHKNATMSTELDESYLTQKERVRDNSTDSTILQLSYVDSGAPLSNSSNTPMPKKDVKDNTRPTT